MLDFSLSNIGGSYCKDILIQNRTVAIKFYEIMKDRVMSWNIDTVNEYYKKQNET